MKISFHSVFTTLFRWFIIFWIFFFRGFLNIIRMFFSLMSFYICKIVWLIAKLTFYISSFGLFNITVLFWDKLLLIIILMNCLNMLFHILLTYHLFTNFTRNRIFAIWFSSCIFWNWYLAFLINKRQIFTRIFLSLIWMQNSCFINFLCCQIIFHK